MGMLRLHAGRHEVLTTIRGSMDDNYLRRVFMAAEDAESVQCPHMVNFTMGGIEFLSTGALFRNRMEERVFVCFCRVATREHVESGV